MPNFLQAAVQNQHAENPAMSAAVFAARAAVAAQKRSQDSQRETPPAKRHKSAPETQNTTASTAPRSSLLKQRYLELQSFTGFPHLRIKSTDGSFHDATVEKQVPKGVCVGYDIDGSKEVIDIAHDASFSRLRACKDLTLNNLEDACSAAVAAAEAGEPQSSDQEDESTELFEVDKILSKRYQNNRWEYLVSWKGYTAEHNTYEPKSNLSDCKQLVSEFEKAYAGSNPTSGYVEQSSGNRGVVPFMDGLRQGQASAASTWQAVEEKWIEGTGAVMRQPHRWGDLKYRTICGHLQAATAAVIVPEEERCCARWNSQQCEQAAAPGKGYCGHHYCLLQSRLLGQFRNILTIKEELELMRVEDDRVTKEMM